MDFDTGRRVGKYTLGKLLGQGGFGVVFVAHDVDLDRDVALKFLLPEHVSSPSLLQRFLQEARSAAKIGHPGIVTVFESGQITGTQSTADGAVFIAMELLRGETLSGRLERSGRLEPSAAIEICRQVASALEAAHEVGIVHRDLKPDNIYLARDPAMPAGERVKVLDFGIAKLAPGGAASGANTHSLMVFGTPLYMSPEQCRSSARIDHRSDIYSLGCILFELVTGRTPFAGEAGELIAHHQLSPCPTARSIVPQIPLAVDAVITAMLAKDPGARPQTMAQVASAFIQLGVVAAAEAPTILPDTSGSMQRFTPLPAGSAPRAVAANPTTLGAAAGESPRSPRPRRPTTLLAVGGLAIAGAAVAFAAMRGNGASRGPGDGSELPSAARASSPAPDATIADAPSVALPTADAAAPPPDAAIAAVAAGSASVSTNAPLQAVKTVRSAKVPTKGSATPKDSTKGSVMPIQAPDRDPDRDRDTIVDRLDACPDQPGPDSSDVTSRGCPKKPPARLEPSPEPVKDGLVDPFRNRKQP